MPPLQTIDSPHNPLIKQVAKLRSRRGREQQGKIIIDGTREVVRAVSSGVVIRQVFVQRGANAEAVTPPQEILAAAEAAYALSERAFRKIAFG